MLLCLCLCGPVAWGQDRLQQRLGPLRWEKASFEQVLEDIRQAADVNLIYSTDQLPAKSVTIAIEEGSLEAILNILLLPNGLEWLWMNNEVVIRRAGKKNATINGYIKNKKTGEPILQATLLAAGLGVGAVTNEAGFFSLTIPRGDYTLGLRSVGFSPQAVEVKISRDTLVYWYLEEWETELAEVVVTGLEANSLADQLAIGQLIIRPEMAKKMPLLLGEPDVVKAVDLYPGVLSVSEGSIGYNVRGGSADQNLMLIDGTPLYNVSHFGFFSVFNPDAIQDVTFSKGGIAANYGGRLSSILDVHTREGNSEQHSLSGSVGTLAVRGTVEGPFAKGKGSYLLSGRRTFLDLLFRTVPNPNISGNSLYFFDSNAQLTYRMGTRHKLSLSNYLGRDRFGFGDLYSTSWGNQASSLQWHFVPSSKLYAQTTVYLGRFRARSSVNEQNELGYLNRYNLLNLGVKQQVSYYHSPKTELKIGWEIINQRYFFGEVLPASERSIITPRAVAPAYGTESALFVSWDQKLHERLLLQMGLRYSQFANIGPGKVYLYNTPEVIAPETSEENIVDSLVYDWGDRFQRYGGLEPRLSLHWKINPQATIKASYNRMRQYLRQLTTTNTPSPVDMWAPVNPYIPPQISDQLAIGYFYHTPNKQYAFSVEGYYKQLFNQVDFKPQATLLFNDHLETEILIGEGDAYGLEILAQKTKGRFQGWVSYTLSRSVRRIPGINGGKIYPASFDRRHDLALVGFYRISPRVEISANWLFASGVPFTFPVGKYEKDGFTVPYYTSRNGFRLPANHRLDLSVNIYRKADEETKNQSSFNFSIYNLYNRKNPFAYVFRQQAEDPSRTEVVKLYLFSIIPSFTYNFRF